MVMVWVKMVSICLVVVIGRVMVILVVMFWWFIIIRMVEIMLVSVEFGDCVVFMFI